MEGRKGRGCTAVQYVGLLLPVLLTSCASLTKAKPLALLVASSMEHRILFHRRCWVGKMKLLLQAALTIRTWVVWIFHCCFQAELLHGVECRPNVPPSSDSLLSLSLSLSPCCWSPFLSTNIIIVSVSWRGQVAYDIAVDVSRNLELPDGKSEDWKIRM